MKGTKHIFGLGLLVLALFTACGNVLDSPRATNGSGKDGLVRIYLGEKTTGTRTVQPGQDALSGYRLTFVCDSDSDIEREPVDITGTNYADVYLNDGTWTITAKAYKLGGTIGEESDKIAEGSITVTLADGAVEGAVSPIILRSSAVGTGTLHYRITLPTGVTGTLKLWDINDTAVSGFGSDGVLTFAASFAGDYPLTAGRYIAEANLTNHEGGGVGFRREVVEIWADTVSDFIFAPAEFLDPNGGRIDMEEGIYIGILSFDAELTEVAAPTLLNASGYNTLRNNIDTEYEIALRGNTLLYYGVHKALVSLKDMEPRLPVNTQPANIITFTDGFDNGSTGRDLWQTAPLDGQYFGLADDSDYLAWLSGQLADTLIKGNPIASFAYGIPNDTSALSDKTKFNNNMASLKTESGEYSTSIQWDHLSETFEGIAENIEVVNTNYSFDLMLTHRGNGRIYKMTFDDVTDPDLSTVWVTGDYTVVDGANDIVMLNNLQYSGIEGKDFPLPTSLYGIATDEFGKENGQNHDYYKFHFDEFNLVGNVSVIDAPKKQWLKAPSDPGWEYNEEYSKIPVVPTQNVVKNTSVIYLVLDSSSSLDDSNIAEIRNAAKGFIDILYHKLEETQTYTVTAANTITAGTVSATPTSGSGGTTVTLSNTPDSGYILDHYTVNGTAISGNSFTLNGNVVVGGVFNPLPYTVTVASNITGGSISASPTSGPAGTIVTLSNTPSNGYDFDYYIVNGWPEPIEGSSFTLQGNATVSAVFTLDPSYTGISNISYSGDAWTLQSNGWYKSRTIGHSQTTKYRVDFTSTGYDNQLVINLEVSSELDCDFAFVGALNSTASYSSNYFGRISGSQSTTITIPVPNPGDHFVEIGYRKDGSVSSGSDCAWFKIVN